LLTLNVALGTGKCTPGGYMYPRLGPPGWTPRQGICDFKRGQT